MKSIFAFGCGALAIIFTLSYLQDSALFSKVSLGHVPGQVAKTNSNSPPDGVGESNKTTSAETPPDSGFGWTKCRCVHCEEDKVCGGLWHGNRYPSKNISPLEKKKIHIVVSHCKASLNWMPSYLGDLTNNVASIHILSKCGHGVEGAPENAEIQVIPNVGRNDHSFAHYITSILPKLSIDTDDDSTVVFLKDTMMQGIKRQFRRTDLKSLVQLASSSNGFACGISLVEKSWSAYHDKGDLFTWTLKEYEKGVEDYHTGDGVPFESETVSSVGDFYTSLNANPLPDLVQVCYQGMFAASTANIFKQDAHVWKTMEKSLSRGDNVEEGHYAERLWGALLATPLHEFQIEALRQFSTRVREDNGNGIHANLCHRYNEDEDDEECYEDDDEE